MEFKSLNNIETSFRYLRIYGMIFLCGCILLGSFAVWKSYAFAERQREKIYVLDQGKSLMLALSQDVSQNRPVEAKEHVRRFHELFFTLAPSKNAIEENIDRALLMCDKSAFDYYKDIEESGWYARVIARNIHQIIRIENIDCNFDSYPYQVITTATLLILRESNITERSLVTQCRLLNSVRSDDNPHGFFIEGLEITENKDLKVLER